MYDDDADETPDNYNRAAEQIVLGAMLLNPDAIDDLAVACPPAYYYLPHHAAIAEAIIEAHYAGRATDPISIHDEFLRHGQSARIGGAPYLLHLMGAVPAVGIAHSHAEVVKRYAEKRCLADVGTYLQQMGTAAGTDLDDIPELYAAAIKTLTDGLNSTPGDVAPTAGDIWIETLDDIENPATETRVPTGIRDLDSLFGGGWAPGQLVIVGARPAVGKSTLGLGAAREAAIGSGIRTLLVSLEMSRAELMRRLISAETKVLLHHLVGNAMDDHDWQRIRDYGARIADAPLHIDDTPELSLAQLRQSIATMKRTCGLGLVIVDYVQLMSTPRAENRQQGVAAVSRGLKRLAKEFSIPIIALAQLNRESEKRGNKQPAMSDLRESGGLEADADTIILMHREDAYERESPRAGECDLIVAKNRNGPTGTVTVAFQGHYARCADMAAEPRTTYSAMNNAA